MVGPSLEVVIARDPALETTRDMIRAVRKRKVVLTIYYNFNELD